MSCLSATLFGPPAIFSAGRVAGGLRHKSVALFAYLAVEGRPVGRDTLSTMLWPCSGQTQARANLRSCIFQLSEILDASLDHQGNEYLQLDTELCRVDVAEFRRLIAEARLEENRDTRVEILTRAESIFPAPFMEGFTLPDCPDFDTWEFLNEELFRRQLASILHPLIEYADERRDWTSALRFGRRLIALDPLEEGSHRLVMRLLARSGQRAAALEQYAECRGILNRELDEEPEAATEELVREIRRGDLPREGGLFPGTEVSHIGFSTPNPGSSFCGRRREMDRIGDILKRGGLLATLTGPAGTGKTRLSIEAFRAYAPLFPGGVIFIELSRISCPDELPTVICGVCGLRELFSSTDEALGLLARHFSGPRSLVVLDNFEHLIECRRFVESLLQKARSLSMLVTSREALHIPQERLLEVEPFDLSGSEANDAVTLFLDRAGELLQGSELSRIPNEDILPICALLDGLPLAIELAVPLLKVYTLEELKKNLSDPLHLLRDSSKENSRHASLQQAISSSYALLGEEEALLFSMLSIFPGGFTLAALEEICGEGPLGGIDLPSLLGALIQKSLVRENGRLRSGEKRFSMLESIRQFALRRAEESGLYPRIRQRFNDYYTELVDSLSSRFYGPKESEAMHLLDLEQANLRRLLDDLYAEREFSRGLGVCVRLHWFWYRRGLFVFGERWLAAFLEAEPDPFSPLRAPGRAARAWMLFVGGEWRRAQGLYAQSLYLSRRLGDKATKARALAGVGVSLRWMGDTRQGDEYALQAVEVARSTEETALVIFALIWAYATTGGEGDGPTALEELEEAADLSRVSGNRWYYAHALNGLADIRSSRGEYERAATDYRLSLQLFEDLEDRWMCAWCEEGLGLTALRRGSLRESVQRTARAIRLFSELGDRMNVAVLMVRMADIFLALKELEKAARCAGGASLIIDSVQATDEGRSPRVRAARGRCKRYELDYPLLWAEGRKLGPEVDYLPSVAN